MDIVYKQAPAWPAETYALSTTIKVALHGLVVSVGGFNDDVAEGDS